MINPARGRNNDVISSIMTAEESVNIITAEPGDAFHRSQNGPRQRMITMGDPLIEIKDQIIRGCLLYTSPSPRD